MELMLKPEEKQVITMEIMPLLQAARELRVTNAEERNYAVKFVKNTKDLKSQIEERFGFTKTKKLTYAAYESARETEKAAYDPIDEAEKISRGKISEHDRHESIRIIQEQREAQEREEQKKREEEAARQAEIEVEEKKAFEEAVRIQREKDEAAKTKQDAIDRGNNKIAQFAAKQEAKLENQLQTSQEKAAEKIEELKKEPEEKPVFTPPPPATKKLVVKARVTSLFKLAKLIADGVIPFSVIEVKASALNDWAKTQSANVKYDGLELYQDVASNRIF